MVLAGQNAETSIAAARDDLLAAFACVPPVDTAMHAEWRTAISSRLKPLAAKIVPTMSPEQGKVWLDAMTDALSDLPAMIALTAAKRAIHVPMKFLNEVEGVIREFAAEITTVRRDAIWRLERLLADLAAASRPTLPPVPEEEVDPAEIVAKIESIGNPELRAMLQRVATSSGFVGEQQAQAA